MHAHGVYTRCLILRPPLAPGYKADLCLCTLLTSFVAAIVPSCLCALQACMLDIPVIHLISFGFKSFLLDGGNS